MKISKATHKLAPQLYSANQLSKCCISKNGKSYIKERFSNYTENSMGFNQVRRLMNVYSK